MMREGLFSNRELKAGDVLVNLYVAYGGESAGKVLVSDFYYEFKYKTNKGEYRIMRRIGESNELDIYYALEPMNASHTHNVFALKEDVEAAKAMFVENIRKKELTEAHKVLENAKRRIDYLNGKTFKDYIA